MFLNYVKVDFRGTTKTFLKQVTESSNEPS